MADKFYSTYYEMRRRCKNNPNRAGNDRYAGRGIHVCKRWMKFKNFKIDMFNSYKEGLTIERINNDKNYSPENCKWATQKEQANNRSTSRIVNYMNIKKTLAQWIDYFGLKSSTVRQRYYVYKWPIERCLEGGRLP